MNIVTTLISQLVTTACGIIMPRILIGSFGSEAYGITVSIAQFLSYVTLLESGIGGVARARLYEPLALGDKDTVSGVYNAIKTFFGYVAIAFVVYSIVLGVAFKDIAHVTLFSRPYIFALVIIISLATLAKYMGGSAPVYKQYNNGVNDGTEHRGCDRSRMDKKRSHMGKARQQPYFRCASGPVFAVCETALR